MKDTLYAAVTFFHKIKMRLSRHLISQLSLTASPQGEAILHRICDDDAFVPRTLTEPVGGNELYQDVCTLSAIGDFAKFCVFSETGKDGINVLNLVNMTVFE